MTPKRIAYVLHIFPKLSETFIPGELAELRRRGIALRILSLRPPREELQHEMIGRAGLVDITTYDVARFAEVIHEFKPQLLHAHFATEATAKARELSQECDLPFTFTAHGYDIHRKPPGDFRERALAARAVVTVSDANANYIAKTFDVPAEHLRVIPCGVDTERFCPAREMEELAGSVAAAQGNRENSVEGLKLTEEETYALIITDLKMPDMDGMEFLSEMKQRQPDAKVIMMTGYSTVEHAEAAMKQGAYNYIEKPFTPDTLVKAVKEAMSDT